MWRVAFRRRLTNRDIQLQAPEHEILTIPAEDSDEVAGQKVREIFAKIAEGQYGKKVLLKIAGSE